MRRSPHRLLCAFENKGEYYSIQDVIVLILSGQLLHELISVYCPFVMNTKEEIKQAYDDFNQGKFNIWRIDGLPIHNLWFHISGNPFTTIVFSPCFLMSNYFGHHMYNQSILLDRSNYVLTSP